jgi:hypothetical protein
MGDSVTFCSRNSLNAVSYLFWGTEQYSRRLQMQPYRIRQRFYLIHHELHYLIKIWKQKIKVVKHQNSNPGKLDVLLPINKAF